jgi:predicted TIM-barrel fold metal-dependent hydrolase
MEKAVEIVDFHAHIMSLAGMEKVFPESRNTFIFRHVVPFAEPIADLTESVHDRMMRFIAMNFNDDMSRFVYSRFGLLVLAEALRLFKRHGLERLIHSMDRLGISQSVIHSLEPLTTTQEILDETSKYPGRFCVFGSVESSHPDPVGYLAPFIENGLIHGVKIHPMVGGYQPKNFRDHAGEFVALASEFGLPVAIHTGHIPIEVLSKDVTCLKLGEIAPLLRAFPKCIFILNHMGWESWRGAIELAKRCDNVILETSWQPAKIIRRAVDAIGPERVLFGSDFPLFQQSQALAEVRKALSFKEFRLVASENGKRLLKHNTPSQQDLAAKRAI